MVKFGPKDKRTRLVLLASLATSIVILNLFLFGAILTNMIRGDMSYTHVDMVAGAVFVFVITMIISLSLWPKIIDRLESREESKKAS
ncbi:hypothetical protein ACSAZK_05705 [Methanosarcina sp. Mfa9]|uniref:hypothetical protein n=1 Tax=Methanosarcina sp. Mfa9 TaxID=3439063 RepID=UPI003F84FD50